MAAEYCTYNLYDNCYVSPPVTPEEDRARKEEREVLKACKKLDKELQMQEERERWLYM